MVVYYCLFIIVCLFLLLCYCYCYYKYINSFTKVPEFSSRPSPTFLMAPVRSKTVSQNNIKFFYDTIYRNG